MNLAKQAGKKVAEKGVEKVSTVVVKKAGDKIENVLRKRGPQRAAKPTARPQPTAGPAPASKNRYHQDLIKLNNLIA